MKNNKPIKKPISKGKAKVPVIMQMEELECGAASLSMILAYYGRYVPLSVLRKECGVSRDGVNAKSILQVARIHNLEAKGYKLTVDVLKENATYPSILYWENCHFVVLVGIKNDKYYINDPAKGLVCIKEAEFKASYSGFCLMFNPNEDFEPGGEPDSAWDFVKERLKGAGSIIAMVIITTLILTLSGLIQPIFPRIYVDNLLIGGDTKLWAGIFFAGFGLIMITQLIATWIRVAYFIKMQGKMAITANSVFVWHLLRMPMEFFSQRSVSDLTARKAANETITESTITTYAPLVLDFCSMVFYFVLMLTFSPILSMIGLASIVLNIVISILINKKRVNLFRTQYKNQVEYSQTTMLCFRMIETIKSTGSEENVFKQWSSSMANCMVDDAKALTLNFYLGQIPSIISLITSTLILCMGIGLIIRGSWTMGIVSAFTGYLSSFSTPLLKITGAFQQFQEYKLNISRISDVLKYEADVPAEPEVFDENASYEKLSGEIEFKNITFGYNPLKPALINNFNMKVEPGKSVAFVGGSGSGKSTLAKLLSGLYKPWEGEILFDGQQKEDIKRSIFTASISSVDQEISLFQDSIKNNITMWDKSTSENDIILAAQNAMIHNDIMDRPLGYSSELLEGGSDLSGGQKQRIEIARALANNPTILVLDEATSALDADTEFKIMNSIKERGITLIIISHRLSTIRDCDEIIVLKNGIVEDRGRHDELMERCDYYRDMITRE